MRRSALIVAPLLAFALVAGCDQGDNNNDNNLGDDGSGSDSNSGDKDSDSNSGDKDSDSDGGGGGSLESCIVGDWEADADTLEAMGLDQVADLGADMSVDIVFTFKKGGDFDWNFDVAGSGAEQGATFSMDMDYSLIGSWTVTGSDQMDLTLDDATGSVTVSVAGQEQTRDLDSDDLGITGADDSSMAVTCSGSTLEMVDDTSDAITLKRK